MCGLPEQEVGFGRAAVMRWARSALVGWFALHASIASAEHDHGMAMSENHHEDSSELSLGVSIEAAQFDTVFYVGSYQAITPSLGWMYGRFGASATSARS